MEREEVREKLIELMKESRDICRGRDYEACKECSGYGKGVECITILTADHLIANGVTVRAKGEWIPQDNTYTRFMCSVCEAKNYGGHEKYCSNCGADMRGDSE